MRWQTSVAVFSCAIFLGGGSAAASNVTDHWWTPTESGWGVSVTQQDDVAFMVFFIYDAGGQPVWLHGVGTRYGYDMERNPGFAGPLYRTTGLGGPFDSSQLQAAQVGTVTFEANGADSAALEYIVNGVRTVKAVRRLTFRKEDWSGLYFGSVRAGYRACAPTFVPAYIYDSGFLQIQHEDSAFSLTLLGSQGTCTFTGSYAQQGRIGAAQGTYACEGGTSGSFTLKGLESAERTFGARLVTTHPSCGQVTLDVAGTRLVSD